ncbi:MAG TPA: hypothetical protein VF395_05265 [Polyangiaceae bacterium]
MNSRARLFGPPPTNFRPTVGLLIPLMSAWLVACGGGEPEARAPVVRESGKDQVLRVAHEWESRWEDKGFRSPPSRISLFASKTTSRIALSDGSSPATETLTVEESFKLTDGSEFVCRSGTETQVAAKFGDHAGETAVELRRPAVSLTRACSPPGFPEPVLELEGTAARFALRGDRLVPFAPPKERREYIPAL